MSKGRRGKRRRKNRPRKRGKPRSLKPPLGATIVHCGHDDQQHLHWWFLGKTGIEFTRPDGSTGESSWLVACDGCFLKAGGQALMVEVRGDGTWKEDAEAIDLTQDTGHDIPGVEGDLSPEHQADPIPQQDPRTN